MKNKLLFLLLVMIPSLMAAQDQLQKNDTGQKSFFWILLQALFALALVIGGIFLIVWVLKQFMNRTKSGFGPSNNEFSVLRQIPVTPKQNLYAVRFLDDLFVLGSSEQGLTKIESYREFDQWEIFERNTPKIQSSFKQIFLGKLGRQTADDRSKPGARS